MSNEQCAIWRKPTQGLASLAQDLVSPAQKPLRDVPAQAGVGDRDAVTKIGEVARNGLVALEEVAFEHDADERRRASEPLFDEAAPDFFLSGMLLAGVGMTAVHHEDLRQ